MITNMTLLLMLLTPMIFGSMSPVKMTYMIMMASMFLFFSLNGQMGSSWIPCIMFMLFMGGILIMFMILSSLMPLGKSSKFKYSILVYLSIFYLIWTKNSNFTNSMSSPYSMKSVVWETSLYYLLSITVLLYFIGFLGLLKKYKSALRSLC